MTLNHIPVGARVQINLKAMRSSNRSCVTPNYPSDSYLDNIAVYKNELGTITKQWLPGFEYNLTMDDGKIFHVKHAWVTESIDFNIAFDNFCNAINSDFEKRSELMEKMTYGENGYFKPVSVKYGKKNVKVFLTNGGQRHVYCFVNMVTGDIYKAATWSAPAKGIRGNIFKPETYNDADKSSTYWLYNKS